jgi:hypothetical protein
MKNKLKKLESKYGTVVFKGIKYYLTDYAVAGNYGTEGAVAYRADAVDAKGEKYQVTWETTEQWDRSEEYAKLQDFLSGCEDGEYPEDEERLEELSELDLVDTGDESNACDWDNPIGVDPI